MKRIIFILSVFCFFIISTSAHAVNTQFLRYYFMNSQAVSLVASTPQPVDTMTLGFGFNYANQPFELGNSNGNNRVQGVVDHLFSFDFQVAYSLSDRVALGFGVPVHITHNIISFNNLNMETPFNMGDIMLSGIYTILPHESNMLNIGVAIVPFVTFPTGDGSDFVGDDNVTGGFILASDVTIDRHYVGLNLGLRLREQETFLNLDLAHELLFGLAYQFKLIPDAELAAFTEFQGATVMKDFFQKEVAIPFEGRIGLSKAFLPENQLKATVFGGMGFTSGYDTPNARVGLKVTYNHMVTRTREVVKVVEAKIKKIEKELKELTIYYPTDGDKVDPFYDQKIAAIADILRNNPDLGPLYIIGHTDDVGSHGYNQVLSEKRAGKAAKSIMNNGLSDKHIVWVGLGEIYPVVPNTSDANRALNRRTLFTFIKPQQLQEKFTKKGNVFGVNTVTGKRNDSYTEVLKKLETQKQFVDEGGEATVVESYKDKSQVIVEGDGTTTTKDTPAAAPQYVPNQPKSKTVVETKIETPEEAKQRVEEKENKQEKKKEKKKTEKKNTKKGYDKKKSLIEEIDLTDEGDDVMEL